MRTALYAGSFDPIHLGHLGIIETVAAGFDRVVVAVLANPNKPRGMFDPAERVRLVEEATLSIEGAAISAMHFYGLTVDLALTVGAHALIRAAHKEQPNEVSMAAMNERMTGIATVFVPARPETMMISSSMVRALVGRGHVDAAQRLVPPAVGVALAERASSGVALTEEVW